MDKTAKPNRKSENLSTREVNGDLLVVDQDTNKIHQLNATAQFVWQQCDGETTIATISQKLSDEFEISIDQALGDTATLLDTLSAEKLIFI